MSTRQISAKRIAGCVAIGLISATIGVFGISTTNQMSRAMLLHEDAVEGVFMAGNMETNILTMTRTYHNMVIFSDQASLDANQKIIDESAKELAELWGKLYNVATLHETRNLIKTAEELFKRYMDVGRRYTQHANCFFSHQSRPL
ncbi:MAG: MCP four helix bundle domain-containing protein [Bacteroidales bacterium]|jgi:hypothetical protein|nr:MCP four helix bundle domain-containing protein [Bacteroidales bacterium]